MIRADLVNAAAGVLACRQEDAAQFVADFLQLIEAGVADDGRTMLRGFGTFERVRKSATVARDVNAKRAVVVPARTVVRFRAARGFREEV